MKAVNSFLFIMMVFSVNLSAQEKDQKAYWKEGFRFESPDKEFKLKFGGRIMNDWAIYSYDDSLENIFGEHTYGTEFRRVRFFSSGQIYNNIKFKLQLDFAGGGISLKDVYLQFNKIPFVGDLRIGHFKEPFRLEALISSKYITFMERSFPVAFSPERNTGFMIMDELFEGRMNIQTAFFVNTNSGGGNTFAGDGYNLTSRVAGLPYHNEEKNRLLHLGLGYSYRAPFSDEYKVSSRPEAHMTEKFVSTGTISNVGNIGLIAPEFALVIGPFSLQGEYIQATVNTSDTAFNDPDFSGYYGYASYFITGESRSYKDPYSGFGRVIPENNVGQGGIGAWEVGLRYSGIDLNNKTIRGGELNDITVGLNWYLNPSTRIMFNYVLADLKGLGTGNIFQTRFQIDF